MPSTTVIASIGILVISMVIGFLFYYITTLGPKEEKKQQIGDILSLVINFMIFIWIGKIVVHLAKFVQDPLAVLAYPSNSYAFYIATIFIIVNLIYRMVKHQQNMPLLLSSFVSVFLAATFTYEFLQIIIEKNNNWIYLSFITFTLIIYLVMIEKVNIEKSTLTIAILWLVGQFVLSIVSYATIFSYHLSPIYFVCLLIFILSYYLYRKKRRV